MRLISSIGLISVFVLELCRTSLAADFYVATNGLDAWSGEVDFPNHAESNGSFASIGRARDAELVRRD